MGVHESHWSKVERGLVNPSREFLKRFEIILGKRPGEVMLLFGIAPDWLIDLFRKDPESILSLRENRVHDSP